jgi:hypothetical protein
MSRFFIFKDIMANTKNNTINNPIQQSASSKFSKLDSQTVAKCFYLWLIRQNNNDYIGLAKNTRLLEFTPTFWIDERCYILLEKAKCLLSFDGNIERTPLVNECLQIKVYFCGNREKIDERSLTRLNYLIYCCWFNKFSQSSYNSINLEFQDCDEMLLEYHNVDQLIPTFYKAYYDGSDDVTMDLSEEYIIHNKFQNYLIKTMKLDHKRKNPFRPKRNSANQYHKYSINFKVEPINGILMKRESENYCSVPFGRKDTEAHHLNFDIYLTRKKAFDKAQKGVEKDTEEMRKEYDCLINEYNDFLNTLEQNFNTILSSLKDQTSALTQRQQRELEKFLNKEQNFDTLLSRFKERSLTILQKQKRELERSYLNNQEIDVI